MICHELFYDRYLYGYALTNRCVIGVGVLGRSDLVFPTAHSSAAHNSQKAKSNKLPVVS